MKLLAITGFLGSGKTTAILAIARSLTGLGRKVAIVVNEVGEIGIDGAVLKQISGNVWELAGGCICCTLVTTLGQALADIERQCAPDVVLVEPSGAVDPNTLLKALEHSGTISAADIDCLALVDPLRLKELLAVLGPLMEAHVAIADSVAITKADLATFCELEMANTWVRSVRPNVPCNAVDVKQDGLWHLVGEMLLWSA